MRNRSQWANLSCVLLILFVATLAYFPVLFDGKTQVHLESVTLGFPFLDMLSSALHGGDGVLWTPRIYGGHPIFAEGQGGFAHPLNLLAAALLPPVSAYNLIQWLEMILSGIGMFFLCRSLNCSRSASLFAVLALILSSLWVFLGRTNLGVGVTITWLPWALWAMHNWLNRADIKSAILFGVAMSFLVLGGYPHIVHGTILYAFVCIVVSLCFTGERERWKGTLKARVLQGLVAVAICLGLSAVQLLPLLELVNESHREDGVSLHPGSMAPLDYYLRGLVFSFTQTDVDSSPVDADSALYFPVMGSLLVCVIAAMGIFLRRQKEAVVHGVATVTLLVLGVGIATPIFVFVYLNQLIPGIGNFRIMYPYLFVGTVGIGVVAALSLDSMADFIPRDEQPARKFYPLVVLILSVVGWGVISYQLHTDDVDYLQYYVVAAWFLGTVLCWYFRKARWIPLLGLLLLCVESLSLRLHPFSYGDSQWVVEPDTVKYLQSDPSLNDFKVVDNTPSRSFTFLPPQHPGLERALEHLLASLSPASNALWDISNIAGNTALTLDRRMAAEAVIQSEIEGLADSKPGLRLIDFMALKYITVRNNRSDATFPDQYPLEGLSIKVQVNPNARPRFQVFEEVMAVRSTQDALEALAALEKPILVIENASSEFKEPPVLEASRGEEAFLFELVSESSSHYEFAIAGETSAWFFIADANYPGWTAYLDGETTEVFSAQVLGKAVFVPYGTRSLTIVFEPVSFRLGLGITIVFLAILLVVFGVMRLQRIGAAFHRPVNNG